MKLNQPTNLRIEDYPEQAKWIGRLFNALNPVLIQIQQIFDSNVDFMTNIRSITKIYDVQTVQLPLNFAWPYPQAEPQDLRVLRATADNEPVCLIPTWSYDASDKQVSVTALDVLSGGVIAPAESGTRYKFSIRVTV